MRKVRGEGEGGVVAMVARGRGWRCCGAGGERGGGGGCERKWLHSAGGVGMIDIPVLAYPDLWRISEYMFRSS